MDDVAAALAAETRRLRSEVKRLEARLRALETSRWYRLNPRRALRRVLPSPRESGARINPAATPAATLDAAEIEPMGLDRFRVEIFDSGEFSRQWALQDTWQWEPILHELEQSRARNVLEIGCFEGLWTCLVLWRLPQAHLTCIDTFEGGLDHEGTDTVPEGLETVFDRNVRLVDASRVRKLVGRSRHRLGELVDEEAQFELIYVDGSHLGLDVLIDAAYAWQLLAPGGFLVFDDYSWAELGDSPLLRPRPAIDAFLTLVQGTYELILSGYKLGVRKRA